MTSYGNFKVRNTARAKALRNAATPAERLLWQYLSRSQLGAKFSRQMPVGPFYADFLCREASMIIELDGFSHDVQPQRDVSRDAFLSNAGFHLMHFPNAEVLGNVEGVITAIRLALAQGSTRIPTRTQRGSE